MKQFYVSLLRSKKIAMILTIAILSIAMIVINTSYSTSQVSKESKQLMDEIYRNQNIYQLSDNFEGEHWSLLRDDPDRVEKLMHHDQLIRENPALSYYELAFTQVVIPVADFPGNADFYLDPPQDGLAQLKSFQVSPNINQLFPLQTQNGYWFSLEDSYYAEQDVVPLILGSAYKGLYEIGDEIPIYFYFGNFTGKVKDFLQEDAFIVSFGDLETLTHHILLPMFAFDHTNIDRYDPNDLFHIWLEKNSGLVLTDKSADEMRQLLAEYAQTAGLSIPYGFGDHAQIISENYGSFAISFAQMFQLITLFVALLAVLFSVLLIISKLKLEIMNLWVYSLFSKQIQTIVKALLLLSVTMMLFALMLPLWLQWIMPFAFQINWVTTMLFITCFLLITCFCGFLFIRRLNIDQFTSEGDA